MRDPGLLRPWQWVIHGSGAALLVVAVSLAISGTGKAAVDAKLQRAPAH